MNIFMAIKNSKKIQMIIILVVVIIGAGIGGYFVFNKYFQQGGQTEVIEKKEEFGLSARKIDGVLVPTEESNLFPWLVMIENLPSVRPQVGLAQANLVYEALTEGGITRFLAVYASGDLIEKIGPVRSARSYFLDWAAELGGLYAHCGGSPESLSIISQLDGIVDLNQIGGSHPYFWRDQEKAAPHNLFTSTKLLVFAQRDKETPLEGNFTPWLFKKEADLSERPQEEKNISLDFSSYNYKVEYKYNREENYYERYLAGKLHQDEKGKTITVKNVVVQFVKTSLADAEGRLKMETIGEGKATVFLDGEVILGNWKKASREERTKFYTEEGEEIKFNPGNIWVEVIPTDRTVNYN